jgi:hypothetical protein
VQESAIVLGTSESKIEKGMDGRNHGLRFFYFVAALIL